MRKAMVILFACIFALLLMGGEMTQQRSQAMPVPTPVVEIVDAKYPGGLLLRVDTSITEGAPNMTIEIRRTDDEKNLPADVHVYEISILDKSRPEALIQRFQCLSSSPLSEEFLLIEDENGDGFSDLSIQNGLTRILYHWDEQTSSFTESV